MNEEIKKRARQVAKDFINAPSLDEAAQVLITGNLKIIESVGESMFNFSHLYHEKTVPILSNGNVLFEVTVQEIPTGKADEIQNRAFQSIDMEQVTATGKQARKKQMMRLINSAMKDMNGGELSARQTLLGVKSWTLKDADGKDAPITYAVWQALPQFVTKQIEKAVEELNPELDEEFQDEA